MTVSTDQLAEQLELDVDEDDVTWHKSVRSLPISPGNEETVGGRLDALEENLRAS